MANNAKHPQITLLLTRPERGSDAFWSALSPLVQKKLVPLISPLIRIKSLVADLPPISSVVFTSANGPRIAPKGNGRDAYCVGVQTANAARDAGWNATYCGNTADELVTHLIHTPPTAPLVHLCGTHTRGNVALRLTNAGIKTQSIAIYDQVTQNLSTAAHDLLSRENTVIVPLFSPRSAGQFVKTYKGCSVLHVIALSNAVADELHGLDVKSLHICAKPTRNAMVHAVQNVTADLPLG